MIGALPKSLDVCGEKCEIRSDFRAALLIFEAFADENLSDAERAIFMIRCLYKKPPPDFENAHEKAVWFLDGGDAPKPKQYNRKVIDWAHDESFIFPAINKVAGTEVRALPYLHWWTFLGFFGEIKEGLFALVMHIRTKKAKRKPLEKWEKEFYAEYKELIEIPIKLSNEEKEEIERFETLCAKASANNKGGR